MGRFEGINVDTNPKPGGVISMPIMDDNINNINDAPQAPKQAWVNPIDSYPYDDKYVWGKVYVPNPEDLAASLFHGAGWLQAQMDAKNARVVERARTLTYMENEFGIVTHQAVQMAGLGSGPAKIIAPSVLPDGPTLIIPSALYDYRPEFRNWSDAQLTQWILGNGDESYGQYLRNGGSPIPAINDILAHRRQNQYAGGSSMSSSTFDPLRDEKDHEEKYPDSDDEDTPLIPQNPLNPTQSGMRRRIPWEGEADEADSFLVDIPLDEEDEMGMRDGNLRWFEIGEDGNVRVRSGLSRRQKAAATALLTGGSTIIGLITDALTKGGGNTLPPVTPTPTDPKPDPPITPTPTDPKPDPPVTPTPTNPTPDPPVTPTPAAPEEIPETIDKTPIDPSVLGVLRPQLKQAGAKEFVTTDEQDSTSDKVKMYEFVLKNTEYVDRFNSLVVENQRNQAILLHDANVFPRDYDGLSKGFVRQGYVPPDAHRDVSFEAIPTQSTTHSHLFRRTAPSGRHGGWGFKSIYSDLAEPYLPDDQSVF